MAKKIVAKTNKKTNTNAIPDLKSFSVYSDKANKAWSQLGADRVSLQEHFTAIDTLIKEVDSLKNTLNNIHFQQEQMLKDYQASVKQMVDTKSEEFTDIDKKSRFTV